MTSTTGKSHRRRGEEALRVTVRLKPLDPKSAREMRHRQLEAIVRLLRRASGRGDRAPGGESSNPGGGKHQHGP